MYNEQGRMNKNAPVAAFIKIPTAVLHEENSDPDQPGRQIGQRLNRVDELGLETIVNE